MPQQLVTGLRVLNSRFRLVSRIEPDPTNSEACETWVARDDDETPYLLKAWPTGDKPDLVLRAVWDRELRVLYRASSSAGAEDCLLVVREAQFDKQIGAFVLLTEGPGYETLASQLSARGSCEWLKLSNLKDRAYRRRLWKGFRRIAVAVRALHTQQIIHRSVSPESVFVDSSDGPDTMRLGSFEWSVRVGAGMHEPAEPGWSAPPEVVDGRSGYTFDSDWFAYGILLARGFLSVEGWRDMEANARHTALYSELSSASPLTGRERDLIKRLIDKEPRARLTFVDAILRELDDVIAALTLPAGGNESRPLHLVVAASNTALVDALCEMGFVPDPAKPQQPYSHRDPAHVEQLKEFIRTDVAGGLIYGMPRQDRCVLRGKQVSLLLRPYQDDEGTATWDFAHASHAVGLAADDQNYRPTPLDGIVVSVLAPRDVRHARDKARSWEPLIPKIDEVSPLAKTLVQFHDFLRCTNQLELLLRDAEIAAYEVLKRLPSPSSVERIVIRERKRERPSAGFSALDGGMIEMLQRELDSNKEYCDLAFLTEADSLLVRVDAGKDPWQLEGLDTGRGTAQLTRRIDAGQSVLPDRGHIRTYGQYAAVTLIRRRTDAIDRLQEHSYLLRALAQPGQVFMDTDASVLPAPIDPGSLDDSKLAVIQDVLRVRPIYALQGPPGTGKTTLVAHLLRQILADDPVAQILVTAPGHSAVDVLRQKVRDDVFAGASDLDKPLSVRLGRDRRGGPPREGSVTRVTEELLGEIKSKLTTTLNRTPVQASWLELVDRLLGAAEANLTGGGQRRDSLAERTMADVKELVKRSASITYCTTTAYDLEELASGNQSFDWSIVEEAGKSHGFDLALPLQAGHRWLLLGDHYQLPPYRIDDYAEGIGQLAGAVEALGSLPSKGLVDFEWIKRWNSFSDLERTEFQIFCKSWLRTFKTLFGQLKDGIHGTERITVNEPVGAAAGRLSAQYRMHPAIGNLISKAFYPDFGGIVNKTQDPSGHLDPRIIHRVSKPLDLLGKAICWVDTPWCQEDPRWRERGPTDESPRYTNPGEVDVIRHFVESMDAQELDGEEIAVLSPYSAQVAMLDRALRGVRMAGSIRFRQSIQRQGDLSPTAGKSAHTVDSFQGNEADVVVISLVRNNARLLGEGLGFLRDDPARFNVLLSRAQKLLVLVGSWEFFKRQVSLVPRENREHPLWALATVMDEIQAAMDIGLAVRVSATDLLGKGDSQ